MRTCIFALALVSIVPNVALADPPARSTQPPVASNDLRNLVHARHQAAAQQAAIDAELARYMGVVIAERNAQLEGSNLDADAIATRWVWERFGPTQGRDQYYITFHTSSGAELDAASTAALQPLLDAELDKVMTICPHEPWAVVTTDFVLKGGRVESVPNVIELAPASASIGTKNCVIKAILGHNWSSVDLGRDVEATIYWRNVLGP